MRAIFPLLASLCCVLLSAGCVDKLHPGSSATDVKLAIESSRPEQYVIRVEMETPREYAIGGDGRVTFTVPAIGANCDIYMLGIEVRKNSVDNLRIAVRHGGRTVRKLTLAQITKLPKDAEGYNIVKIED